MSLAAQGHAGRRSRPAGLVITYVLAGVLGLTIILPVVFGVLGGFKDTGQLADNALGLPHPWVVSNYTGILTSGLFWRQVGNSTLIAVGTALIVVGVAACAAFVLARFAFRGREFLAMLFAIGLMFPFAVAILPLFVLLRTFELLDNPFGVILPQAAFGLPVTIIILRSFFRVIPREVEEAATMDGCSTFRFFWSILLPMARPALATVSVLAIVITTPTGGRSRSASSSSRRSTRPTTHACSPTPSWRWSRRSRSTRSPSGSSSAA